MRLLLNVLAVLLAASTASAKEYTVTSPSGRLSMIVSAGDTTSYRVTVDGQTIMNPGKISMTLGNGNVLGEKVRVTKVTKGATSEKISAPLYRQSVIDANYNWMILKAKGGYTIEFRAYDDGVAYRFTTSFKEEQTIVDETSEFNFAGAYDLLVPFASRRQDQWESSFESEYTSQHVGDINSDQYAFLPIYASAEKSGRILLMESDVEAYPGMYLVQNEHGFKAVFPPVPAEIYYSGRGAFRPKSNEDYIARVDGTRTFPWRIVAWGEEDKNLPVNDMVFKTASPSRIEDTSWITPGQSTWDWWNGFRRYGVDFVSGINTETYKYDIDVAARYGMEYVVLDEGWYSTRDLDIMKSIPEINIPEICTYAASKGVKIVLWVCGGLLDRKLEEACSYYSEVGVSGFKVDFFDAQDQGIVNQIYRLCDTCAKYHLILDLHGMYKPTGLSRTYPNVVNYEGVFGLEQVKWTNIDFKNGTGNMPRNDVIIPFIRMASGPLDYTQGALNNAQMLDYRAIDHRPMSQGTRAHQVALYVVFDSPFVMLCDSPSDYIREDETTRFITSIPATMDKMVILSGEVGQHIITAREKDGNWYIGGITDWTARDLIVDFSFLPDGDWDARLFRDGANSHELGIDYKIDDMKVGKNTKLPVHLAPGGGFAMILSKQQL